jgi:diguanylate cyclase (GGDEF)-like protein/PAS domain S-box-containing protein
MKPNFLLLLFPSLLLAQEYATLFMSSTLLVLLLTLIFLLFNYVKRLQRENIKNSALFEYSDVPTLLINTKSVVVELNESAKSLLGYSKKQLASQKWYERLLPDENAIQIRHHIHQTILKDARTSFDTYIICAQGEMLMCRCHLTNLPKPMQGSLLTLVDITIDKTLEAEHVALQEQLAETQSALREVGEQFKVTFDIAINGIALLDEEGKISYLNRAITEMYEYNEDYLKHLGITPLLGDDEAVQALLDTAKQGEKIDKMHIHSQTRMGKALDVDLTLGYLPELKQYYMVVQDITKALAYTTELKRSKKTLEQRVIKDCLTTAYNRSYMEERLEHLIDVEKIGFGLIILDIDHFKQVNDTYGHLVGDDVLINLVNALQEQLRKGDTLARFGGEEFVIILPHATHAESLAIAHKLREYIASLHFEGCPKITCSFGVEICDSTTDRRSLLLSADRALYKAKESGRNCVVDAHALNASDYSI